MRTRPAAGRGTPPSWPDPGLPPRRVRQRVAAAVAAEVEPAIAGLSAQWTWRLASVTADRDWLLTLGVDPAWLRSWDRARRGAPVPLLLPDGTAADLYWDTGSGADLVLALRGRAEDPDAHPPEPDLRPWPWPWLPRVAPGREWHTRRVAAAPHRLDPAAAAAYRRLREEGIGPARARQLARAIAHPAG